MKFERRQDYSLLWNTQNLLKEELTRLILTPDIPQNIYIHLINCISQLVVELVSNGEDAWPNLVPFLFNCASSVNPQLREGSLKIFEVVAEQNKKFFLPYFTHAVDMLKIRLQATKTSVTFLASVGKNKDRIVKLQELAPLITESFVQYAIDISTSEQAEKILEEIIHALEIRQQKY
ncbi:MAG: hypothetical protein EZS28_047298 [Streblomastix strix]|uniref:IPO4/5-like TPR repeats domain-containing protein n=1 Tax=Streblomastix strix TaxID=222440 RepID=A0A5J4TI65_9EUKA|nr:MAG: hypothetical protein EZS28_047298 [Streblomastix strix]